MNPRTSRRYVVAALAILAGAAVGYVAAGRTSGHDRLEEAARSLVPPGAELVSVSRNTGDALIVGAPSVTVETRASEEQLVEAARSEGWEVAGREVREGGVRLDARADGLRADIVVLSSGDADVQVEDAPPTAAERLGLAGAGGLVALAALAAVSFARSVRRAR